MEIPHPRLLTPRPTRADVGGAPWRPARRPANSPQPAPDRHGLDPIASAATLQELRRLGYGPRIDATEIDATGIDGVRCRLDPKVRGEGGGGCGDAYRLDVGPGGAEITAAAPAGLFYGLSTFTQWLRLHPVGCDGIRGLSVDDRPSFAHRGALIDISRNRVPKLAELEALIDLLASFKINQVQLYMEHTFAYRNHRSVWRDASPLTAEDIQKLDRFCRERHVDLVPNQNSFGHFHRWLVHEPYRALAECPEGVEHPFSPDPEPFSLCADDPGSLELLKGLYGELLPNFHSRWFNVGLDEALDLGRCRTRELCAERGKELVYLDFLRRVHALVADHGRRMMFWGDMILERPELIAELPADAVALEWGYEADHPFAEDCPRFAASGRDFYVCPGTASWNSFSGRSRTAVANLALAAREGTRHGALGYLVTDWGDHGHLQPAPASWPGWLAGAAFVWNADAAKTPEDLPIEELLDRHVFRDRAGVMGRLSVDLGDIHRHTGAVAKNGSPLFFALLFAHLPADERRGLGMTEDTLTETLERLDQILEPLGNARMDRADADLVEGEVRWMADALRLGARFARARLRSGEHLPPATLPALQRRALSRDFDGLLEALRPLWLARCRPGGLDATVNRWRRVGATLEADA
ncbi:MAG: family 20 glycosylhydrolase [Acidobacteriota bacterium]